MTHGLAMSVYVATRLGIGAAAFWRELDYPDAWWMDEGNAELHRLPVL